jgi:hypothetical protein
MAQNELPAMDLLDLITAQVGQLIDATIEPSGPLIPDYRFN